MTDLIARALRALCVLLFPATGARRAVAPPTASTPARESRRRPLPPHKSPYAEEAHQQFDDDLTPVRPYVAASPPWRPAMGEQRAQAERRWAADMATRGIDVGPSVIHGVHVAPGSRTVRVGVAV